MYRTKKIKLINVLLFLGVFSAGWAQELNWEKASDLLIKSLTYDRNFEKRSAKKFTLAIIFMDNEDESVKTTLSNLEKSAKSEWKRKVVEVITIKFESVTKLLRRIKKDKINCIFIHESMTKALSSIQQITRGKKIPSISFSETFVDQGVSVGIYKINSNPKLIINRKAALVEGINFSPNLFKIAKLVAN